VLLAGLAQCNEVNIKRFGVKSTNDITTIIDGQGLVHSKKGYIKKNKLTFVADYTFKLSTLDLVNMKRNLR